MKPTAQRYSTAPISISRTPAGLWKRTTSPSRALSTARASGEIQLMRPCEASASSTPTICRVCASSVLEVAEAHRRAEEDLLQALLALGVNHLGALDAA